MVVIKKEEGLKVKLDLKGKGDYTDKLKRKDDVTSDESDEEESSESGTSESESDSNDSTSDTTSSSDSDEKVVEKKKQELIKKKSVGRPTRDKFNSNKTKANNNAAKTRPKRKRRKPRPLTICLTNCRYEIVRNVAKQFSLLEVGEDEAWNIYWTDFSVSLERAMDMRRYQLVNHFPGMNEICRKDFLSRNLNRMKRLFQNDYDVFPKTWSLPTDLGELQTYAHTKKNKTYICKPEMGCQGRGIFLIRSIKDLNPFGKIICQLYVSRPFLIDNFKFDLRIYVLMTSCDPLRIYVFKEGLARFATAKYKPPTNSNTENSYMHLTNYAVNKYSRDYVVDDEGGSKRKLTAVYRWLEQRSYDTEELMNNIDDVIVKTIISAHPILKHNYRTCFPHHDLCSACFEILGFDILLDYKLKPYVLEVNHSPSFHTDAKLDKEIKEALLHDTFAMLNMKLLDRYKVESDDRKRIQERLLQKQNEKKSEGNEGLSIADQQFQWELDHCGGYRLIYPSPQSDKYDKYFEQNLSSLYHETTASQARANCTRNQMEEYNKQKQQEERKRLVLAQVGSLATDKKDKLRPESPADPDKPKLKKKPSGKNFMIRKKDIGCFAPSPIVADEELDRMKCLMQRGMLIRSLGIEIQVFKLLCQIGNLKPEEEKLFRRMHGFAGASAGAVPKMKEHGRLPETMEHMQRGDASSQNESQNVNHETNLTNKEDFKYPQGLGSTTQTAYFENGKMAAGTMKNPYNVPYNSPAQFGHQNRPRSSPNQNQNQAGVSTVSQISNFMDKVMDKANPSTSTVTVEDTNYSQLITERRFYSRYLAAVPVSHLNSRQQPAQAQDNLKYDPGPRSGRYAKNYQNLRAPPKTAGINQHPPSPLDKERPIQIQWPPPPLASQVQPDPNKYRAGQSQLQANRSYRPPVQTRYMPMNGRGQSQSSNGMSNMNGRRGQKEEPVQCTQMFFNDNANGSKIFWERKHSAMFPVPI